MGRALRGGPKSVSRSRPYRISEISRVGQQPPRASAQNISDEPSYGACWPFLCLPLRRIKGQSAPCQGRGRGFESLRPERAPTCGSRRPPRRARPLVAGRKRSRRSTPHRCFQVSGWGLHDVRRTLATGLQRLIAASAAISHAERPVFRVTVSASGDDLQPVQAAIMVAGDEATVQQGGKALDSIVDFEARDLAPCGYVPQPDRVVR